MSNKWIQTDQLSEKVREMLAAFEASFSRSNASYTVSHEHVDAVFVTICGTLCAYQVVHFINTHPEIYVEIEAKARNYIEFRMFCSDWLNAHELPRMQAIAVAPARSVLPPKSVRVSRAVQNERTSNDMKCES